MHFKSVAPVVSLLLLSSVASGSPLIEERTNGGGCNADNCLRALRRFKEQAIPFCSSYLSIPMVTLVATTTTPIVTSTVTTTIVSPLVDKRAAATYAIRNIIARDEDIIFGLAPTPAPEIKRRDPGGNVPPFVTQYAASRISSACSCITITQATTTVTSTAPTHTATTTVTVTEDFRLRCSITYNTSGNGSGNRVDTLSATGALDCCQQCQSKTNCVASAFVGGGCQHLMNNVFVGGEQITGRCPLGVENYSFGPAAAGVVYAGPCGV